jgi:hypothetical protein
VDGFLASENGGLDFGRTMVKNGSHAIDGGRRNAEEFSGVVGGRSARYILGYIYRKTICTYWLSLVQRRHTAHNIRSRQVPAVPLVANGILQRLSLTLELVDVDSDLGQRGTVQILDRAV